MYKIFLKICETQIIIVKLKKLMRKNIAKNWNTTRLTKFCAKDIANISNKVKIKENKKIDTNKLNS